MNFTDWKCQFENKKTEQAVLKDLKFVRQNGVNNVPVMITEDKYLINGVQPQSVMKHTIEEIATKENIQLTGLQQMGSDADSYRQVDGRWIYD